MSDVIYTKMQQAAINLRNKNILVSAAAGSGKTAVLVKRIIDRVINDDDPIDIDRLLVMTFTRAAASQMKEKIIREIEIKRSNDPYNDNLSRQYALVHNASIMTIDSFCLNVVRNHFEEINLNPDFRMADEGEIRLLMQDVMEKLLEEKYKTGDEDFLKMTETFSTGKSDYKIEGIIYDLYKYSQSYPYPNEWLDSCGMEYGKVNEGNIDNAEWCLSYVNHIKENLLYIRNTLDSLISDCNMPNGPKAYESTLLSDIELTDRLLLADTYSKLYNIVYELSDYTFAKLKSVSAPKNSDIPEEIVQDILNRRDFVKASRNACKDSLQKLINSVILLSPEEAAYCVELMKNPVSELISVTKQFSSMLSDAKRAKNIVDFNDLEHFCLEILKNGKETTAKEYSQMYREIYVDEYQDSNLCQEEILKCLTADDDTGKLFMVGDIKQSIYGFRLARPKIFIDKYNKFSVYCDDAVNDDVKLDIKIDLSDNFRSRTGVIDAVNGIFREIMNKEIGGIEYNDNAKLNYGASYKDFGVNYGTELICTVKDSDISSVEAEAMAVAEKINELKRTFPVSCEGSDSLNSRPLKYSDIVILLRSPKGRDTVFMNVLEREGIPVHITSTQGYFSAPEIVTLLNYLKVIDNPLQDIPLAAVMMSVLFGFTEEELAVIRGAFKNGYLYNSCISYRDTYAGDNKALVAKIDDFLAEIIYYRKKAEYSSVEEIITEITDRDYGNYVKAMKGGKKKYANLNMLINQAREYGKTSFKGIFHFNRYIEAIRKYDIDFGEANLTDENDDAVRIMSIHKSKGLEFPVCFVCCIGDKLNFKDAESSVIIDSDYGFVTDAYDASRRIKSKSLFRLSVSEKKKRELLAEELRLLYVAMTRAKEKLILTGSIKSGDFIYNDIKPVANARSYIDLIKYAIQQENDGYLDITVKTICDIVSEKTISEADEMKHREKLLSFIGALQKKFDGTDAENINKDDRLDLSNYIECSGGAYDCIEEIRRRMNFVYPYTEERSVKMSVSELKHKSDSVDLKDEMLADENTVPYAGSDKSFGALHGSAVHRVFELWDYNRDNTDASVKEFLEYIRYEKLMEDELLETVDSDEIAAFVRSDIAERMKQAYRNGSLRREQPFVISLDEDNPDSMLIQGIIDAYFIEDNKIVLVDYKTDKNKTEQMLIEDHKSQLEYYAIALKRMLGLEIKDMVIYSTELRKGIII